MLYLSLTALLKGAYWSMLLKMISQHELPSNTSYCNICLACCSTSPSLVASLSQPCLGNRFKAELKDYKSVSRFLPLSQKIAMKSSLWSRAKRIASCVFPIPPSPWSITTFRNGEFICCKYCHRSSSSSYRPTNFTTTGTALRSRGTLKRSTISKNSSQRLRTRSGSFMISLWPLYLAVVK